MWQYYPRRYSAVVPGHNEKDFMGFLGSTACGRETCQDNETCNFIMAKLESRCHTYPFSRSVSLFIDFFYNYSKTGKKKIGFFKGCTTLNVLHSTAKHQ